ncbi:uncharacterized protein LOC122379584 [Amphibalanus amphitrite]|uniref:uncharacterized protein LOC122379584 n=1 Tax=Amphibalanus amphitrite TaxID=1232801 RepID=UPI001C9222CA|nr:uncharacterized protein LOC122379584 [Amphibalanus amphitrite]XP_043217828.1 uncharacterized protein LOC122379584 [Amphibalanus amphitrite]
MSADEARLPEAERLAALERELTALHELCRRSELPHDQVSRALRPLVSAVDWSTGINRARYVGRVVGVLLVLCAALYLIGSAKPVQQAAHFYTRVALVKILPYWDWTGLYTMTCLVENPLYEETDRPVRTEDSCQLCESLDELERVSNVSAAVVTDNYLRLDRPVVVTDGTRDWPALEDGVFDRHRLVKMFKDRGLAESRPCELLTNLKARDDMQLLLDKMSNPVIKKWFAHWENCDKMAAKVLRTLYRRPYFLPAMVDTTDSNWVLVSSNYTGNVYKMLPVVNDMVWMAQLQGTTGVRLTPRSPCTSLCPEIVDTLHEGEILMFTDFLWMLEYLPGYGTDNVAVGAGGYWE